MKIEKVIICLGFCLSSIFLTETQAAERTWTGPGSSGNWTDPANWDGGVAAPSPGDSLVFAGTATTNTNNFTVGTAFSGITISGAAYTLSGNAIQLTGNVLRTSAQNSTISLGLELIGDNRTFQVDGVRTLSLSGLISGSSTIVKQGDGTLQFWGVNNSFTGGITVEGGTISSRGIGQTSHFGMGTITVNNGKISLSSANTTITGLAGSASGIVENGNSDTARVLTINTTNVGGDVFQGTIQNGGAAAISLVKNGLGTTILTGTNTYTGATSINSGTLVVNGSLGNTAVTVATNGILSGEGTIGGNTTVNGTISAGNGAGQIIFENDFTFAATGARTLLFEGGDLVSVNGALNLNDGWTLSLQNGFQNGGSVVIFEYGTLGAFGTVNIDQLNLGFTPTSPLAVINDAINQRIILNGISAIPEPSVAFLLGLSLAGVVVLRRRRR